jgi:predicted hotdog family 3-hydroxylacyl-ACP dehydratase
MSVASRETWEALIPHAGAMALLDKVIHWNETTLHAIGERLTSHEHPLRSLAGLHAVHLAEYGAQAAAIHRALLGKREMRAGRLVSLRGVQLAIEHVDLSKGRLDVHVERLLADERGAHYAFEVEQQGCQLASGRILVMEA